MLEHLELGVEIKIRAWILYPCVVHCGFGDIFAHSVTMVCFLEGSGPPRALDACKHTEMGLTNSLRSFSCDVLSKEMILYLSPLIARLHELTMQIYHPDQVKALVQIGRHPIS